eukprot:432645-Amorphochlora_amoeboformis.AAC.2
MKNKDINPLIQTSRPQKPKTREQLLVLQRENFNETTERHPNPRLLVRNKSMMSIEYNRREGCFRETPSLNLVLTIRRRIQAIVYGIVIIKLFFSLFLRPLNY